MQRLNMTPLVRLRVAHARASYRIKDQFRKRHPERKSLVTNLAILLGTATIERIPDPAGFVLDDVWEKECRPIS